MKKKLTLLIYLLPIVLMGQTTISKNGTISFDLGKKKQDTDTVQQQSPYYSDDENGDAPPQKRAKGQRPASAPVVKKSEDKAEKVDYRNEGLFQGLFNIGINGCQIDGDGYGGYNYPGLEAAVGAMIKFHRFWNASMEIQYSQEGAKEAFIFNGGTTLQLYRVEWDYIRVPVGIGVTSAKLIMIDLGLSPGFMVRFSERDQAGDDVTNDPPEGQPDIFDLAGYGGLNFIIHRNFMLGGQFSYSLFKVRGPREPGISRLNGEYNNVISLQFTYILSQVKKKKY